ncbi:TetR/AcrR family transcriptional regulator [Iningainema tapete]|uniref:TetR/AcrR family transcriptional regulator n=1 Tax=Iningainema tapete BLCC-T55 TaxID=2748662 RepID=A0A8J7BYE0_9CYAN|nr:TetR/AcrR family transcriptional regulator [Iningainema tapete]MBD2775577.1 TetR/AcrR family transcriptional regulator [Iningainema tapete BLCC-T55]
MPKIVDHDLYRKELLRKCFDLFAQKSYGSVTMRQIADGLEVSTGTLYHYFPSKKALFEQMVEEIARLDILMAAAELEGKQTLQERVEALGRLLEKKEDYFIKQTSLWVDFCQHEDFQEMQSHGVFKRACERYQQAVYDFLGIQDPVVASFILTVIDGLIIERLWGNEMVSFREQCALLGNMLTVYLQKGTK